jgi:hypothetical protein
MPNRSNMSQDDFERLLAWLDHDREVAASKYLEIHQRMSLLFRLKGCYCPEDLADTVVDRVAKRLDRAELMRNVYGEHIRVFLAFTKFVFLEHLNERPVHFSLLPDDATDGTPSTNVEQSANTENRQQCLDICLQRLAIDDRELLPLYYRYPPGEKIAHRKKLVQDLKTTRNALTLKVSRLRTSVADCVKRCVQNAPLTAL